MKELLKAVGKQLWFIFCLWLGLCLIRWGIAAWFGIKPTADVWLHACGQLMVATGLWIFIHMIIKDTKEDEAREAAKKEG